MRNNIKWYENKALLTKHKTTRTQILPILFSPNSSHGRSMNRIHLKEACKWMKYQIRGVLESHKLQITVTKYKRKTYKNDEKQFGTNLPRLNENQYKEQTIPKEKA